MTGLDDLGGCLGEVLLVLHVALDLADRLLVARDLDFLVEVDLLGGLLAVVLEDLPRHLIDLGLDAQAGELLEDGHAVGVPSRLDEGVEGLDLIADRVQVRGLDAGHLDGAQLDVRDPDQSGIEFVPEGGEVVVSLEGCFQLVGQPLGLRLGRLDARTQGRFLVLEGRQGVLAYLELLAKIRQRSLVVLKLDGHGCLVFLPVFVDENLFDAGLGRREVFGEDLPRGVQHLLDGDVDVDGKQARGIFLGVVQAAQVVVGEVEAVLQLGLGVLGISVEAHARVHHLGVVLAGLLALHELFESGQGAERVHDDLAGVRIGTQEELALCDVAGVVRDGVGDVAVVQGRDRDDGDGAAIRQLHGFLVDLGEVGIERTRHGVLGRDLVHAVGHDGQGVGVEGHVGQQDEHLLVLVHGEVFGGSQGHVRDEQALHRRLLGRVDEGDDLVQGARRLEGVAEEEVVVVGQAHAAEDDLVDIGAQRDVRHDLVVRLVRVGEEGDLLAGDEGVVEVDAGDAGRDQLGGLAALVGVDGGAAHLALFSFDFRAAVDRVAVGVEEAAGELVAHVQGRRGAVEGDFGVGRDPFGAGEDLQGDGVALGLHDLGKLAVHRGQLVVGHTPCVEGDRGLGDGLELRVCALECFRCHIFMRGVWRAAARIR